MVKLVENDSFESMLKAYGRLSFLIESERNIKSASSSAITEKLIRDNLPDKDHFAVHNIALGAGEFWGQNRNGDYFPEEMLIRDHPTFVKNGHFFREHKNSNPKYAIGKVVASAFNEPMHRVELIIHGDKRKAEPEYERAKAGKESHYSMSVSVPYDICSCCEHKAAKTIYYCPCLQDHMNQWMPKFKKFAYAENPKGRFFDISDVANNADRIAHHIEYIFNKDDMQKAASLNHGPFSEELATAAGVVIPEESLNGFHEASHQEVLIKLAEMQIKSQEPSSREHGFAKAASHSYQVTRLSEDDLKALKEFEPEVLFVQLAKTASVLPFIPFCAYTGLTTLKEAEENLINKRACTMLASLPQTLKSSTIDFDLENLFTPDMTKAGCFLDSVKQSCIDEVSRKISPLRQFATYRMLRDSLASPSEATKEASNIVLPCDNQAQRLAVLYGIYKVASIAAAKEYLSSTNNTIDDNTFMLLNYCT
jgi:hypothetical protein